MVANGHSESGIRAAECLAVQVLIIVNCLTGKILFYNTLLSVFVHVIRCIFIYNTVIFFICICICIHIYMFVHQSVSVNCLTRWLSLSNTSQSVFIFVIQFFSFVFSFLFVLASVFVHRSASAHHCKLSDSLGSSLCQPPVNCIIYSTRFFLQIEEKR